MFGPAIVVSFYRKGTTIDPFCREIFYEINNNFCTDKIYRFIKLSSLVCRPCRTTEKIYQGDKKIVVLAHSDDKEINSEQTIYRFRQSFIREAEVVYFNDFNIKGGCMGCLEERQML